MLNLVKNSVNRNSVCLFLGPTLLLCFLGVPVYLASFETARVEYERIQLGMSAKDVRTLLGRTVKVSDRGLEHAYLVDIGTINGPLGDGDAIEGDRSCQKTENTQEWFREDGKITVGFDDANHVIWKRFRSLPPRQFFERLVEWMGF